MSNATYTGPLTHHKPLSRVALSEGYAATAIDLYGAGADFERASKHLAERRLEQAEHYIERGLDRLAEAIQQLPRIDA